MAEGSTAMTVRSCGELEGGQLVPSNTRGGLDTATEKHGMTSKNKKQLKRRKKS